MTVRSFKFTAVAAMLLYVIVFGGATGTRAQAPEGNYGVGVPSVFLPKYLGFRARQLGSATPDVMRLKLGYVKGLSRSFTAMNGEAALNLASGAFTVNLERLTPGLVYSAWIVDAPDIDGLPDVPFSLGTILALSPNALLSGVLSLNLLPPGFTVDRVAVVEGAAWGGQTLASGSVNVFQKLFFRRASLVDASTGSTLFDETTVAPLLDVLVPPLDFETESLLGGLAPRLSISSMASAASAGKKRSVQLDKVISQGATLFFGETFAGNGRTCGTCHPASNNLTIDPDFIATRPANDPLFVAEFNPALAQLERPVLMRQFGLILENLDGFSDPANKFVMRGVPHTLGLQVSLQQDPNLLPQPPAEMTGWSGDGAPGTGSLREFATGAVTQHFTKRLNRVRGTDFVLPTAKQLDAMEAFQLSTGRAADFDLTRITFNDANVETGKGLFVNGTNNPNAGGKCAACHNNAGALLGGLNLNINTNVEDAVHPARSLPNQNFPKDGGFGQTNNGDGTFGNRTFNLASVVEAADTAPFFHNNLVDTLERVIEFYTGPEFNNPRAAAARFAFDQTQIDQLADFMRGINTLQNIDVAVRELQELLANTNDPIEEQNKRLQTAFDETQDAIDVLTEGGIFPAAVSRLIEARNFIAQAQASGSGSQRRSLAQGAIAKLGQARSIVAVQS